MNEPTRAPAPFGSLLPLDENFARAAEQAASTLRGDSPGEGLHNKHERNALLLATSFLGNDVEAISNFTASLVCGKVSGQGQGLC